MRTKTLISIALSALIGTTAATAQTWQKLDEPATTDFALGDTVYLYNVQAKKFYTEGNSYGTQASLSSDKALKVCFTKWLDDNGNWDEKTLLLNDSSEVAKSWRKAFIDAKEGMYVDYKQDFFWQVQPIEGSNSFRILPGDRNSLFNQANYGSVYIGHDISINPENTVVSPLLDITEQEFEGAYRTEWVCVSLADFDSWKLHNQTVDAAEALAQLIAEAKELGVDTSEADAAYADAGSTIARFDEVSANLRAAMSLVIEGRITPSDPKDMTDYITNPQYENNDNVGWSGTAPGFDAKNNASCAERWNSNFDVYQTLPTIPNGVYMLEVQAFYRTGDSAARSYEAFNQDGKNSLNAILYAETSDERFSTPVKNIVENMQSESIGGSEQNPISGYFVPNNMVAAGLYFAQGLYNNKLYLHVEDGTLKIGINKETLVSKDWTIWDNWRLTYFGNTLESYKYWMEQTMTDTETYTDEDTYYAKNLRNELNELLVRSETADSKEAILQIIEDYKALVSDIQASIAAYEAYYAKCEEADEVINTVSGTGADALSDYLNEAIDDMSFTDVYESGMLTTDEIIAETEKVTAMIANAYATSIEEGSDVTYIIANANFDKGVEGWSHDPSLSGTPGKGGLSSNPVAEVYNSNFDVYQTFTDVPNGVYRLDVQAFFRSAGNAAAWEERETAEVKSFIYVNGIQSAIKNIMTEAQDEAFENGGYYTTPEGTYVANNMNEASEAFSAGHYENSVYGVVTDGTLRIGIRQTNGTTGARWTCFDNFRLTFDGYNATTLKEALKPLVQTAQALINASEMGKAEETALQAIINTANTSDNGKELFQALIDINDAIDAANVSIKQYQALNEALNTLYAALETYEQTASESAIANASELCDEVEEVIATRSASSEECKVLIASIEEAVVQLKFVDEVASDDNPIDVTDIIINPSFDSDDNTGWSGDVPGFDKNDALGMAEFYNRNYDIYQELTGLKNGIYRLTVNGFYRAGSFDNDYAAYTSASPAASLNAYLYAVSGETQASVALPALCEGMSETQVNAGQGEATVGGSYYVPNNMVAAAKYIDEGRYPTTELVINVTDGTLRLGVKKEVHIGADWTFFDHFTLTYYGTESALLPSGDAVGIELTTDNAQQATAIYTIGGMRLNQLQRTPPSTSSKVRPRTKSSIKQIDALSFSKAPTPLIKEIGANQCVKLTIVIEEILKKRPLRTLRSKKCHTTTNLIPPLLLPKQFLSISRILRKERATGRMLPSLS